MGVLGGENPDQYFAVYKGSYDDWHAMTDHDLTEIGKFDDLAKAKQAAEDHHDANP